jgi:hypothetical protein
VQIVLLLLAIIAVPWMLFPKPFILKKLHTEVPLSLAFCMIFLLGSLEFYLTKPLFYIYIYVYICLWFEFPLFDCEFLQELMNVNSPLEPLQDQLSFQ